MADLTEKTPGEVLADSSVADFIKELGLGIAAAQTALDDNSIRQIEAFTTARPDLGGRTLLDLGLSPAFYHYQHADITCSMTVRMEVAKSDEFGFGVRAGINDESSSSSSGNSNTTTTQTTARRETKTARLSMRSDSNSVLAITGGPSVTPTGTNPIERLIDLRNQLAGGNSGIDTIVANPPTTRPDIQINTPSDKVVINSPTITFLRAENDGAVIRIKANENTVFKVNSGNTADVTTTAQADIGAYANHVADQFRAKGYGTVTVLEPNASNEVTITAAEFDTGIHQLRPDDATALEVFADLLKNTGTRVRIEGFTDRQGAQSRNVALGERRAREVHEYLSSQGVPEGQLEFADPMSRGETAAEEAGDANGSQNQDWRKTSLTLLGVTERWIVIYGPGGPNFLASAVAPSVIGDPSQPTPPNAYIALYDKLPLNLTGNGVTIDGEAFAFSGAAVSGGAPSGSAQAHAHNLTNTINQSSTHRAWNTGNTVRVARAADAFDVLLFATTSEQIAIDETSNFTITENFTSTTTRVQARDQNESRTIAVGVTVDGRFSRQFNTTATGNSTISARLVSVPAPPEFLSQIKDYQNELE